MLYETLGQLTRAILSCARRAHATEYETVDAAFGSEEALGVNKAERPTDDTPSPRPRGAAVSGHTARLMAIVAVNVALALAVFIYGSMKGGELPSLNARTLALGVMPVSAAMGLMLACRRVDFSLPMILAFALAFQTKRYIIVGEPFVPLLATCLIAAALSLTSALLTWHGRISSALWTGILAFSLWLLLTVMEIPKAGPGPWPWPWALLLLLAVIGGGAALLGATGLVSLPNMPPIVRTSLRGLPGLVGAWVLAGVTCALASLSKAAHLSAADIQAAYPQVLSAAVLGGGFILRGKWGAPTAVGLACLGHLVWAFAYETRLAGATADLLVPAGAPLVAVPLYLGIDWLIRRSTGESSPTGLLG